MLLFDIIVKLEVQSTYVSIDLFSLLLTTLSELYIQISFSMFAVYCAMDNKHIIEFTAIIAAKQRLKLSKLSQHRQENSESNHEISCKYNFYLLLSVG